MRTTAFQILSTTIEIEGLPVRESVWLRVVPSKGMGAGPEGVGVSDSDGVDEAEDVGVGEGVKVCVGV